MRKTPKATPAKTDAPKTLTLPTPCINCGIEAALLIGIGDAETIHCPDCTSDYFVADVEDRIAKLTTLVAVCKAIRAARATNA